jgi:hypothetical protein
MDKIDNYLLLHMTDFMTLKSVINISLTSSRFLEPMIQTYLKQRIERSIFLSINSQKYYPISIQRDETHTYLEFVFDNIVFEKDITVYTVDWIFNWQSITSKSYHIWNSTFVDGITIQYFNTDYANITLMTLYDDTICEFVYKRILFSYKNTISKKYDFFEWFQSPVITKIST